MSVGSKNVHMYTVCGSPFICLCLHSRLPESVRPSHQPLRIHNNCDSPYSRVLNKVCSVWVVLRISDEDRYEEEKEEKEKEEKRRKKNTFAGCSMSVANAARFQGWLMYNGIPHHLLMMKWNEYMKTCSLHRRYFGCILEPIEESLV